MWSAGESHYCVNIKGFMKFGTHTNEESDEYEQKWLPLSDFVGLCSKYGKVEWLWRYRSRSKVATCDTPSSCSRASDHLYKYGKTPSGTVDATERTRFSRPRPNDLEDIGQGQRSLYATHPLILEIIIPPPNEVGGGVYWIHLVRPSVRPSVCRRHGFRSISQVCFGISISNFICMLMVAIGRSLLIFSDVTLKMAAWRPYWIFWFPDSNFTSALNINFKLQRHNTYVYG